MPKNHNANHHIIIVGGGITGLSAAWEIQKHSELKLDFTILESDSRWGGKIVTKKLPGSNGQMFVADGGPDTIITRKPEAWQLSNELGIADQIIEAGSETRNMYVLDQGKPFAIPLNPLAFVTSPLISTRGKLRMMAEPFISPKMDDEDESLASFVNRRLGEEALEKFIGPVLAGIYNTDPNTQSILTTSPIMREMEKDYGSLVKATIGRMRARRQRTDKNGVPRFMSYQNGVQELVDRCVEQLEGRLVLNARVTNIYQDPTGYQVELLDESLIHGDAVIISTTANVAAKLLKNLAPLASKGLNQIRHENIGTLSLAYRNEDLPAGLEINGLMVPRREGRAIDAVTFTTNKLPIRAPQGYSLLRVFFGGSSPQVVDYPDDELIKTVRRELNELLSIHAEPVEWVIFRWPEGFPQADVGHLELVQQIEERLPDGICIAGSSYRGIGVPDCIRQGRESARKAIQLLNK
jgi:oxygen-dependent protoporphyrinogen oxidase